MQSLEADHLFHSSVRDSYPGDRRGSREVQTALCEPRSKAVRLGRLVRAEDHALWRAAPPLNFQFDSLVLFRRVVNGHTPTPFAPTYPTAAAAPSSRGGGSDSSREPRLHYLSTPPPGSRTLLPTRTVYL